MSQFKSGGYKRQKRDSVRLNLPLYVNQNKLKKNMTQHKTIWPSFSLFISFPYLFTDDKWTSANSGNALATFLDWSVVLTTSQRSVPSLCSTSSTLWLRSLRVIVTTFFSRCKPGRSNKMKQKQIQLKKKKKVHNLSAINTNMVLKPEQSFSF